MRGAHRAFNSAAAGFARRVIYYGSIMKISLPLDIVPKQQQTDTLDGGGVAGIAYIQSRPVGRGVAGVAQATPTFDGYRVKSIVGHPNFW